MEIKVQSKFKKSLIKFHNKSVGEKIILIVFFLFFLTEAIAQVVPFLWVINNSLKTQAEYDASTFAITRSWQFSNFIKVFSEFTVSGDIGYWTMLLNSLWQSGMFLFFNLLSSMLLAYALAKFNFPGHGFLYGLLIFVQTIPILGTGAAGYKIRYAMGIINNPWLIWITFSGAFDYSCFILYGTFKGVSKSYSESAEMDGANEFIILGKVVFPQVFPCIVALLVTNFVSIWNDYTTAQLYLNEYPNLAYGMFLFQKDSAYKKDGKAIYFAALIISSLPGIILYSASQNLIIKNMAVGGIKG